MNTMKHITPISKAQDSMDIGGILTLVVSLITTLVPIIMTIVDSSKGTR